MKLVVTASTERRVLAVLPSTHIFFSFGFILHDRSQVPVVARQLDSGGLSRIRLGRLKALSSCLNHRGFYRNPEKYS